MCLNIRVGVRKKYDVEGINEEVISDPEQSRFKHILFYTRFPAHYVNEDSF